MKFLVTIIIPTFNRAPLLGETLESVSAQKYPNWECIVVDDGSSDYTEELMEFYCKEDSRFKYFSRPAERCKGANICRNYGLQLAKGDYVNFFDSDDIMHPQKLELQLKLMEKKASVLVVCETLEFIETIENKVGDRYTYIKSENPFEDFITGKIKWLTQAPLWKKKFLLDKRLLFDESLSAGQDWEFHVRALSFIENYAVVQKPLVYLRKHEENITNDRNREVIRWNYFKARHKIYSKYRNNLDPEILSYLRNYMITNYKGALRYGYWRNARKIWKDYLFQEKGISFRVKAKLALAFLSFFSINKGDFLIGGLNISNNHTKDEH